MEKITTIAEGLIRLGYPVHFLTGPDFKDHIESIGATYVSIEGKGSGLMAPEHMEKFVTLSGPESDIFGFNTIFTDQIPPQHRTLQATFANIRVQYGEHQPLIYLSECSFAGLAPIEHGAPGIKPDAALAIGIAPYPGASNDTFPFQSGKHPDTSPRSQQIHFEAQKAQYAAYPDREWNAHLKKVLHDLGATRSPQSVFDLFASAGDRYLQYGVPGFEYARGDMRDGLRFIGAPVAVGIAERRLPPWWHEVVAAKKAGKTVVAVTSSSVVFDNNVLIVPALRAFQNTHNVFVVATLVNSDPDALGVEIPRNARVARLIPLDLALPDVDVLMTNGGYGTVQQAIKAGVPMIVSGVGQDKTHTGGIINYVGNGIYEAVHQTDEDMLRRAFEEIVGNPKYKARSEMLAREYEEYDAVEIVDGEIQRAVEQALASKSG